MGLAALSNALIAAGEATRGQKGAGIGEAFGGFGKSYNAFTAEDVKRLDAQKAVERAQSIEVATLQSKIDDLRAAHATGTVQERQEAQKAVQEQAKRMQDLKMGAADKILSQALAQADAETRKSHYAATEKNAAAQLEAQIARYKEQAREAGITAKYHDRQLDIMEDTRPTAEDKAIARVESSLNRNPDLILANKKLAEIPISDADSPQAQYWRASRDAIRADAYKRAKLDAPPLNTLPKYSDFVKPEVEKPGWFSSSKAVPFNQLPK
jgi:hypothetical protein